MPHPWFVFGEGPLSYQRIGEGHSNITYLLQVGGRRLVLWRGPRPPFPPSTHDMVGEARILRALGDAGLPVPRVLAVCDDTSVLGVPFYVMAHLGGVVITDAVPAFLDSPSERRAIAFAAVDELAALHVVDTASGPVAALGRPEGYLARQVDRFAALWPTATSCTATPRPHACGRSSTGRWRRSVTRSPISGTWSPPTRRPALP